MPLSEGSSQASTPLPTSGGAQDTIGQNFEVDLATGTGSYRVSFLFPPGPRQIKPDLSLGYSTGYGNGVVGLGWSLSLSAVIRSEVDGQPAFDNALDSFNYGGQRLVPVGGGLFRQEVEKDFYRIERVGDGWEIRLKDGTLMRYGVTAAGRVVLPLERPDPVLQWVLESYEDAIGNRIGYEYAQDNGHARLIEIRYGRYVIRLDYEERPDPVTSYRIGVKRIMRYRLREVRLLLIEDETELPVKAYRLGYEEAPYSGSSRLVSVMLVAFDPVSDPPIEDRLPVVSFEYTDMTPEEATLKPFTNRFGVLPPPVADAGVTLLDVDGIGLPGFLSISQGGGHYWPNLGELTLGAAKQLHHFPMALTSQQDRLRVASLSGHGLLDLVVVAGRAGGYYSLQPGGQWDTFRKFRHAPALPLTDAHTCFVDLNFDGQADLLYADQRAFYAVINNGEGDFSNPRVIPRLHDRARFPDVDLSDPAVHFADMTGDGSAALIEVRNRSVTYWPNIGYGRFGTAVKMASAPNLPEDYDPQRIYLTDIDGDGLADLVYVDQNRVLCWFNRAGVDFAPVVAIEHTPQATSVSVMLADVLGHGSQGILWSGGEPLSGRGTHYFLDLAGPYKANLLVRINTPTGAATSITYGTSVGEALRDRNTADASYLPFPVQVIRRVEAEDKHTGAIVVSDFSYHRAFYDRRQRRFLGFGRVERRDIGAVDVPDRIIVTHFHTRPPERATRDALRRHMVLSRMPYRTEVFGTDDSGATPFWVQTIEGDAVLVDTGLDGTPIYFAARRRLLRVTNDRGARTVERNVRYEYDSYGNVTIEEETQRFRDGADVERVIIHSTNTRYAADGSAYLVGLPVMLVDRDGDGNLLASSRLYYDGQPFQGLTLGQATQGILARREVLAFTDSLLAEVYGTDQPDMAALGYFHVDDPELGSGWWITEVAQQTDAVGNPILRRDALGRQLIFEFDTNGIYPIRIENALGQFLIAEYNYRHGQLVRQIGRDGAETRWVFDLHGRLQHVVEPHDADGQPSLIYERAPFERPPRVTIKRRATDDLSNYETQHLYFNSRGERIQTRVQLGDGQVAVSQSPLTFSRGLAAKEQGRYFSTDIRYSTADAPADVLISSTQRDALDRPIKFESPGGGKAKRLYEGGAIHHYDAEDMNQNGPHFDTPRSEYFDAAGRLVSVVERLTPGSVWCTQYQRNAAGLLTGATDHVGIQIFTRQYDLLGRLVALDHREAGNHRYVLDAAGNRVEEWRGSHRLYRGFDLLGRITALHFGAPDAPPVESYNYDAGEGDNLVGRLAKVEGDFGMVEYSYSCCGRLKAKTRRFPDRPGESFTMSYTYDHQGRPLTVTYPNGYDVTIGYDAAGRPKSVGGIIADAKYDPAGYLTLVSFVNGVETTYNYGVQPGQIETLRTGRPGGDSFQHFDYAYDAVGNPKEIKDLTTIEGHINDDRHYVYDSLYRLVEAEGRGTGGIYHHVYEYDALGNLLTRPEINGGQTLNYTGARVTSSSTGEEFGYDDLGNLTSLDGWRHAYDPMGRLTESTRADGSRVITQYDHTGNRVSTRIEGTNGVVRTWICDEAYVVNEDGSTEAYIFFNRHRVAVLRSDGEEYAIHTDPLDNPTCFSRLSDGSFGGQVIYFPYGGIALELVIGTRSRYRFGNHATVPGTGLVQFGVRAYSPLLGRFMQPDPHTVHRPEGVIGIPRGLHSYAYVIDNPVALVDPYGANWFSDAIGWVGDRLADAGRAIAGVGEAVVGAIVNGALATGGFVSDVASTIWEGIKVAGTAVWEGIKWAAGVAWEGIKLIGQGTAFLGTWALTIADFAITWLNPLTWIAFGLDQIDHPIADVLSFAIKFARSPLTTTVGLVIGGVGLLSGEVENVAFKNGTVVFEWDPSSSFSGMTLGGVVHLWGGNANDPAFEHETYHTYQYVGYGDMFIPTYIATGGWGLFSSALAGKPQWTCFGGVNDSYTFGQPLEMGGELIKGSDNCA